MQEKKQGDGASKSTPVSISDCASTVNATTSGGIKRTKVR